MSVFPPCSFEIRSHRHTCRNIISGEGEQRLSRPIASQTPGYNRGPSSSYLGIKTLVSDSRLMNADCWPFSWPPVVHTSSKYPRYTQYIASSNSCALFILRGAVRFGDDFHINYCDCETTISCLKLVVRFMSRQVLYPWCGHRLGYLPAPSSICSRCQNSLCEVERSLWWLNMEAEEARTCRPPVRRKLRVAMLLYLRRELASLTTKGWLHDSYLGRRKHKSHTRTPWRFWASVQAFWAPWG
mgnify:CR=1 FL=1